MLWKTYAFKVLENDLIPDPQFYVQTDNKNYIVSIIQNKKLCIDDFISISQNVTPVAIDFCLALINQNNIGKKRVLFNTGDMDSALNDLNKSKNTDGALCYTIFSFQFV